MSDVLNSIKLRPHWRVTIRPTVFNESRISTLPECWKIIESCSVSLRGWNYPHVDRDGRANGSDWISSWCDFNGYLEYWRFYQSAQFLHLKSFWEDTDLAKPSQRPRSRAPETAAPPSGFVDITELLCTVTEIYEFSARFAQAAKIDTPLSVAIGMVNVKNRILTAQFPKAWWGHYPVVEDALEHRREIAVDQLIAQSAEIAMEEAVWFFHRFQWNSPNMSALQSDQRKLLTRTL
jgi:hypothetical protein